MRPARGWEGPHSNPSGIETWGGLCAPFSLWTSACSSATAAFTLWKGDPGFPVKLLWIPLPLRSLYDSTREEDGRQAGRRIPSFPR